MSSKICPLRNDVCLGRECALAQKIDTPIVSMYHVLWTCGLVTTHNSYKHGNDLYVDSEKKES